MVYFVVYEGARRHNPRHGGTCVTDCCNKGNCLFYEGCHDVKYSRKEQALVLKSRREHSLHLAFIIPSFHDFINELCSVTVSYSGDKIINNIIIDNLY